MKKKNVVNIQIIFHYFDFSSVADLGLFDRFFNVEIGPTFFFVSATQQENPIKKENRLKRTKHICVSIL